MAVLCKKSQKDLTTNQTRFSPLRCVLDGYHIMQQPPGYPHDIPFNWGLESSFWIIESVIYRQIKTIQMIYIYVEIRTSRANLWLCHLINTVFFKPWYIFFTPDHAVLSCLALFILNFNVYTKIHRCRCCVIYDDTVFRTWLCLYFHKPWANSRQDVVFQDFAKSWSHTIRCINVCISLSLGTHLSSTVAK